MCRENKKKICLVDGCNDKAIKSHTIQKALLKQISENGKVFSLDAFNKDMGYMFKESGVNQASTSKLFCKKHDKSLFSIIEDKKIEFNNNKHLDLLVLRSLAHLISKLEDELYNRDIKTLKKILKNKSISIDEYEEINNKFNKMHKEPKKNMIATYRREFNKLLQDIMEENKSKFVHKTKIIHKNCGIYASTICDPEKDWEGVKIRNVKKEYLENIEDISIFLNIFIQDNKTYITISYHKNYKMKKNL